MDHFTFQSNVMENVDPLKKNNPTQDPLFISTKNSSDSIQQSNSNPSSKVNSEKKSDFHKDEKQYKKELEKIDLKYSKGQFNSGLCCRRGVLLDLLGHTNEAIEMYQKSIDLSSQSNLVAYNNLANLFIRNGQFFKAESLLTVVLEKVALTDHHRKNLTLLPMIHVNRGICYLKMKNYEKCEEEVREIKNILKDKQLNEVRQLNVNILSQKNLKFMKKVLCSIEPLLLSLDKIKTCCQGEHSSQIKEKEFEIKKDILGEVTNSFVKKSLQQKQVKKILKRVKKFEEQINLIKTKQIQSIKHRNNLEKKVQNVSQRMSSLEQQNEKLKIFVHEKLQKEIKNSQRFKALLQELQKSNLYVKKYVLEVYWLLNSYFIAFRVAKIGIFPVNKMGKTQNGKFIEKIGLLFSGLSKMPVINNFCDVINKICEIYLEQEVNIVNNEMFSFVSHTFCNELQISEKICSLLINKIEQIHNYLLKNQFSVVNQNMAMYEKAVAWMKKKKTQIVSKIAKVDYKKVQEYQIQALEDVSFIISKILHAQNVKVLETAFDECYDLNFRKELLIKRYKKSKDKSVKLETSENSTCVCTIFNIQIKQKNLSILDEYLLKEQEKMAKYCNEDRLLSFLIQQKDYKAAIQLAKVMDLSYLYQVI